MFIERKIGQLTGLGFFAVGLCFVTGCSSTPQTSIDGGSGQIVSVAQPKHQASPTPQQLERWKQMGEQVEAMHNAALIEERQQGKNGAP